MEKQGKANKVQGKADGMCCKGKGVVNAATPASALSSTQHKTARVADAMQRLVVQGTMQPVGGKGTARGRAGSGAYRRHFDACTIFQKWSARRPLHLALCGEEGFEADVLRAFFDEFDTDQNGCVSIAEFQAGLKRANWRLRWRW